MKTIRREAEPTLKGLRVSSDADDASAEIVIYPWDRVSRLPKGRSSTLWAVYTDDASDVLEQGKRLRLRIRHAPASELAHRAQRRWFRRAWRSGTLRVEDHFSGGNRGCFWAIVLFSLVGGLFSGVHFVDVALLRWHEDSSFAMPPGIKGFSLLLVTLAGLLYLALFSVAVRYFAQAARHANVARTSIDNQGIGVTLRNGQTIYGAWSDLRELRWTELNLLCLRFASMSDIWLVDAPARTRLALQIAQEALQPQDPRQADRQLRRTLLRAALWWGSGCVVTMALVAWLGTDRTRCLRVLPMFLVPLIPAGGMYLNSQMQRYTQHRQRRRHRRGQQAGV